MRKVAELLLVITLGFFLLEQCSALFIPLAYAVFLSFLLHPVCSRLERKGWKRGTAVSVSVATGLLFVLLVFSVFGFIIAAFAAEWPMIHEKLNELMAGIAGKLSGYLGWSREEFQHKLMDFFSGKSDQALGFGKSLISAITEGIVWLVLIPVYVFLLLFYRQKLVDGFLLLLPAEKRNTFREVLALSINTYFSFIKGMALVYLLVGLLNSLGLLLLGVPHPFFFGMLTAVMTFIPYLGILLAGSLPVTYAWMTFGTIWHPLGVIAVFAFVQYLEANVIFPWVVGRRLEMNTLATLIVIIIGGILWGASGMILFVPIAAILKLVADRMEGSQWKALGSLLGT